MPIISSLSSSSPAYPPATNLSQLTLRKFPKNGLKYSGKAGSAHETPYKKDLQKLLNPKLSNEEFEKLIRVQLSGIEDMLYDPDAVNPLKNPLIPQVELKPSKQAFSNLLNESITTNIGLLKSIVPQPTSNIAPPKFSRKIIMLINKVENAEDSSKLTEVLKDAHQDDPRTLRLLNGFYEINSLGFRKIKSSDTDTPDSFENRIPFVFFKNALQAELILIAKQIAVLEGDVKKIAISSKSDLTLRNIIFLDRNSEENQKSKNKMLQAIEEKRTLLVEPRFQEKMAHPITAAVAQFDKISDKGMSIALKNPATRPFESALNPSLKIKDTLSEEQFDALTAIEDTIIKGTGKANIRIRTGGGKTHVMKLTPKIFGIEEFEQNSGDINVTQNPHTPLPPSKTPTAKTPFTPFAKKRSNDQEAPQKQIINLDLNSSPEDLYFITNATTLENKIIQADEAFFWGRLFLDGRLEKTNFTNTTPLEIEKLRNNFLYDLSKKGAVPIIVGASESVPKIQHECDRIKAKIAKEEQTLSLAENRALIKQANSFLYSVNNGVREKDPVFQEILPPRKAGREFWLQQASRPGASDDDLSIQLIRNKTPYDKTDNAKVGISNKEFLIRTAWHIKELCNFADAAGRKAAEDLCEALKPKPLSNPIITKTKPAAEWNPSNGLDELLQVAGTFPNRRFKSFALELLPLYNAVSDLLNSAPFCAILPKDPDQKSSSANDKLTKLRDKLETRQSQLEDLTFRRDVLTEERLRGSKLFLTDNQSTSPSLFETVKGFLPKLEEGERMQYILPDFVINTEEYDTKEDPHGLRKILRDSEADFIFLPHKMENGRSKCTSVMIVDEHLAVQSQDISEIDNFDKEGVCNVLSFFDQTNSIGGDYGGASVNIAKQYVHLTEDTCLSGYGALDRNYLMQYDRNRTDPDEVSGVDTRLIMPRAAALNSLGKDFQFPRSNAMPEELVQIVDQNTKVSDEFHLMGYLASKDERKKEREKRNKVVVPIQEEVYSEDIDDKQLIPADPAIIVEVSKQESEEESEEECEISFSEQTNEEDEEYVDQNTTTTYQIAAENYSTTQQNNKNLQIEEEETKPYLTRAVPPITAENNSAHQGDDDDSKLSDSEQEVYPEEVVLRAIAALQTATLQTTPKTPFKSEVLEVHLNEVAPLEKPSTSPASFNIRQLAAFYQPSFTLDKRSDPKNANNGFMVLKEVYENDADLTYNSHADITHTITRIIVQSSLTCDKEPLSIDKVIRALEISRKSGSLSLAFSEVNSELTDDDRANKEKYQKFSAHFQRTCAQCGIYSEDSHANDPKDLKGMRTCNIPKEAVEGISKLRDMLIKKGTLEKGLQKYEPDNREKLNLKKTAVSEILEREKNLQLGSNSNHR